MSTAPYLLGALATVCGLKALFRGRRAVVKEGRVAACPGQNRYQVCDSALVVETPEDTPVYANANALVVAVGPDFVVLAARQEPVTLLYDGVEPAVEEGQHVGRGQELGRTTGRVAFQVTGFVPGGGSVKIDPASWLAARGQRIAHKDTGSGSLWCEQGRHIAVPASAGRPCDLREPDKGAFALLPVTVSVER